MLSRAFLNTLLATLSCAVSVLAVAQEPPKAVLPIVDVHFHYMLFMKPEELLGRMNKNGVTAVVSAGAQGSPTLGNPWKRDHELWDALKNRLIPAAGSGELRRIEIEEGIKIYSDAENERRSAAFRQVIGQMHGGHRVLPETFPNSETSHVDPIMRRRVPTDGPYFQELMKIAMDQKIPLPMHMEWHPESVAQLGKLLTAYPQGVVLLSHCGKISLADDIRKFFEKYQNVYCDLGFRGAPQASSESRSDPRRLIFWPASSMRKADIKPEWLKLVEDYPDRFMVAVDDVISWEQYDETVTAIRTGVLDKLKPQTAEKVAYKNALKLFGLPSAVLSLPVFSPTAPSSNPTPAVTRTEKDPWVTFSRIAKDLVFPDKAQEFSIFSQPEMALYKPEGPGPFPAVVLLHQCGGLRGKNWRNESVLEWAKQAVKQGYVALILDSFLQRNVDMVCFGAKGGVNSSRGVTDTLQAAEYLSKFDFVDGDRVALVGFSWGASIALLSSSRRRTEALDVGKRFRAAASFYPGCAPIEPANGTPYEIVNPDVDQPLLVLMGELDNETPPTDCVSRLEKAKSYGAPVEWHVYPDTGHCWDCKNLHNYSKVDSRGTSVTYKYSADATADASKRLFEFLHRTMPVMQ